MKTKLFLGMLTAAATLAVAPAVFADDPTDDPTVGTIENAYKREVKDSSGGTLTGFKGTSYTTDGTVGSYTLALPEGNVYFTGKGTLTITSITNTPAHSGYTYKTDNAFIVEGTTVILDGTGVNVEELGLNLTVGTMESATLKITNGAKVTTGAYYNTVGSNYATGTIEISGTGSELNTQQIEIGAGCGSLATKTSDFTEGGYYTQYLITLSEAQAILGKFKDGAVTDYSYGIVNVKDGGTWSITGTSSATNYSQTKLQLSNGEINITGSGSQLLLGTGSCLTVVGEFIPSGDGLSYDDVTGLHYTEKITVTGGGKIANAEGATPFQVVLGNIWYASNDVVTVLVSGSDEDNNASTFDVTIYDTAWIGANAGTWSGVGVINGGTQDVKITASDGGVFKISAGDCVAIAADNYMDSYLWANVTESKYGHSYGITVSLSADSGGLIELNALNGSAVALGAGAPAEGGDYKNIVNVTADNATVSISGGDIYANYGTDGTNTTASENVYVNLKATNGGEMTLSANADDVAKQGSGTIVFNKNTQVTVEKGSSLTTEGIISFESGSSISVDATSKWTTTGEGTTVTFNAGSGLAVGAAATASGDGKNDVSVALGSVTIAEGASITVTIDISSLDNYTSASVAILTADSIIFGSGSGTELTSDNVGEFAASYITADEKGYILDSWSWADNTLYANITTMPEPSMFGMLFGLSALGLVSTRRRRRKA